MKHCANPECDHVRRFGRIAEYRDEITSCSDCGESLVPGPAPELESVEYQELVTIYVAQNSVRGHLLRSLLEERWIPVVVTGDVLNAAVGELPATVLNVQVKVPPEFAEEATEIARAFDRGDYEVA